MEGCGCGNKHGVGDNLCCHENLVHDGNLGLQASHRRNVKNGSHFDKYFPKANLQDKIVNPNGTVKYTVEQMEKVVQDYHWQVRDLAKKELQGATLPDTLEKVWQFCYSHYQYKLDKDGVEELRTPARAWHDGQILARNPLTEKVSGIDCDCFSITVSCILTNLGIKHKLRVTKYSASWQHVYVVVPVPDKRGYNWIIDCVLDKFNIEKTYTDKFDYTMDGLGIPVAILSGLDDASELHGIIAGTDFDLQGFAGDDDLGDPEAELGAIKRHLQRTRNFIARNPETVAHQGGARAHVARIDHALKSWDKGPKARMQALTEAAQHEHESNVAGGLAAPGDFNPNDGLSDPDDLRGFEGDDDYSIMGLGAIDELDGDQDIDMGDVFLNGRAAKKEARKEKREEKKQAKAEKKEAKKSAPNKFMQKVRTAAGTVAKKVAVKAKQAGAKAKAVSTKVVKKVAAAAKKTVKAVVRYNPVTAASRGGFLLFMKQGLLGMAKSLRPGYWTVEEAAGKGIDRETWQKSANALASIKKIFINTLQGKEENLKAAIIEGAAKHGLSGVEEENLGAAVAAGVAAAAAPIAAAAAAMDKAGIKDKEGFVKKVANFFKKAGKGIKNAIQKRKEKKAAKGKGKKFRRKIKKADGSFEERVVEEGETLPEGESYADDGGTPVDDGGSPPDAGGRQIPGGGSSEEGGSSEDGGSDEGDAAADQQANKMINNGEAIEKMATSDEDGGTGADPNTGGKSAAPGTENPSTDGEGFFAKAKKFAKENPGKVAIGAVALVGTTLMIIPTTRKAIVGMFTGKKKALSGPGKKRRKSRRKRATRKRVVSPNVPFNKRKIKYVKM